MKPLDCLKEGTYLIKNDEKVIIFYVKIFNNKDDINRLYQIVKNL